MDYNERYLSWLNDAYFDPNTREELASIKENEKEIEDRFFKDLAFGTGGLRGIIGAGTNRMNMYTVGKATQGLATYILNQGGDSAKQGVCIAYDSRRFSPEFADVAARVLCANGIHAYVFESLRPTPELSFSVRTLGCIAGIVVTASHNPPEYNGYKVYWSDGGQVPFPRDEEIIQEVNNVADFKSILTMTKEDAIAKGLYHVVGKELDDAFVAEVKKQSINPAIIKKMSDRLTIVYTPLHGTGNMPVRRVLKEMGFQNVHVVPEQELPDENFSTVGYPNPEDPKAFALAMKLADQVQADLILATDPDCDRVGAVVKNDLGEYVILSGNMTGVLLTQYILSQRKLKNDLPDNGALISTIVSTDMTQEITKAYGVAYVNVLTGFKYIGEKIKEFEESNSNTYLFGFEESYGYLAGTYARDKDAVVASMLICEMAAYYKDRNMNLYDGILELYKKYGYYKEMTESITLKGVDGLQNMQKIMSALRQQPPTTINAKLVTFVRDYETSKEKNTKTGEEKTITLPVSNVLYYCLEDHSWVCVRPSGTEPKIKVYFGVKGANQTEVDEKMSATIQDFMKVIDASLA